MSPEELTLLAILITALVTITGWIYTAGVQNSILEETRKAQNIERELAVFRERLSTIRGITSILLDMSTSYGEVAVLISFGQFDFEKGSELMKAINAKTIELSKILYDPGFRSISDLLSREKSQQLYSQIKEIEDISSPLHAFAASLNPSNPRLAEGLQELARRALDFSQQLVKKANMITEMFTFLDRALADGKFAK